MSSTAVKATRRVLAVVVLFAAIGAIVFILYRTGFIGGAQDPGGGAAAQPAGAASSPPPGARRYKVCAWSRGSSASLARAVAANAIDEVDLDWYHSLANGSLRAEGQNMALVRRAQKAGVAVFATVTNRTSHQAAFDGAIAASILATRASRDAHVARLVALCIAKRFDGIDMDWEELKAADRARFTAFIRKLAAKLHANGKGLSIAVYPKTSEPGDYDAQKAEDYKAIGAVVDEFKVMTYAYSGPWSKPGPQMPLSWAKQVLAFARSKVPAVKVYMGLPFFGFDWQGSSADYVLWKDVAAAEGEYGGSAGRDAASGEAILRYSGAGGAAHTAYYQDRAAVRTKLKWMKAKEPTIAGVAIWVMGGEDPGFWKVIAAELPATPR
jgi:spore germination protein